MERSCKWYTCSDLMYKNQETKRKWDILRIPLTILHVSQLPVLASLASWLLSRKYCQVGFGWHVLFSSFKAFLHLHVLKYR